jgi:hypothetical protein
MKYILDSQLFGGRGASYTPGTDESSGQESVSIDRDFAARMNVLMKRGKMSQDIVLDNFRKMFTEDSSRGRKEHLIAVDENGFTYALNHGQRDSVGYDRSEVAGKFVIHNHPNGSVFSRQDLRGLREDKITGIVASGKSGDYVFRIGKKFDYTGFDKALSKSPVTNTVISKKGESSAESFARTNHESHSWLKRNAKKYGYTYEFRKKTV